MYIAKQRHKGTTHYYLRQSYPSAGTLKSRDLFYLGEDPRDYLVYPDDGCAFYIRESLCDRLVELGVKPDNDELERVFFPYLDPETQRVITAFSRDGMTRSEQNSLREQVRRSEEANFHIFDRRRMHYLRFMEMDQSRIARSPQKIYRELLDKSRDEIEQFFMEKESILEAREKKVYPYVIFDVASHFPGVIARRFPQVLAREEVDACFLEEVCRLNADKEFWADLGCGRWLNEYLVRYVCWFFDADFGESRYLEDLLWEWIARKRAFRPPPARGRLKQEEALAVMGLSPESFSSLSVRELTSHYRSMAQQRHPDKGGNHEAFIKLNQAFETLVARLKAGGTGGFRTTRG
ncbi:MAG TPA: J domain-containing protein [Desulfosalsimonadaceae bacterium]|nr:J domain-containing protein [Desulfosalsimonadaceae bacterium]